MATKTLVFTAFLVATALAVPTALAQSGLNLVRIRILGTVFCSVDATAITATTQVFPNALVQLQCGNSNVASATTNSSGVFQMVLDPLTGLVSSILSCNLAVNTPLAACNVSLPATGVLQSPLSSVGTVVQGLSIIQNLVPIGFSLVL